MRRRVLASLAVTVLLAHPALGQELQGTLKRIRDTSTIRLGYREASPPFSFRGTDQKPVGYSVDLCGRVVASVQQELGLSNLQTQWVPVTPESRIPAVVQGTIDLECGSTTITLGRQREVDFSHLIFVDGGGLLVRTGTGIAALGDLGGRKVAVIPGTTTERALAESLQKASLTVEVTPVKEHSEGLAALDSGAVAAYASDRVLLVGLALRSADPKRFVLLDSYLSYEPYGLMLRRGDADFRLAVNRALSRLYRSPQVVQLYERWFGGFGRPTSLLQAMYLLQALPE
jgi:glutamate/aspartate transport system substrate-binding protein